MSGEGLDRYCGGDGLVLSREERDAFRGFRYGDMLRMSRGDTVRIPGEPGRRRYRIIGWDLKHGLVMLQGAGGVEYAPPTALALVERG